MDIYHYDQHTGEYTGSTVAAEEAGQPFVPDFASLTEPPEARAGFAIVWGDEDKAWKVVADYRGHTYWLTGGVARTIAVLGEEPPEGASDVPTPEIDVHHYAPDTGEHTGTTVARMDPMDNTRPLVPAHATLEALPDVGDGLAAVWVKEDQAWNVVADYRGHTYWLEGGVETTITALGEEPPEGASENPTPPPLPDMIASALGTVRATATALRTEIAGKVPPSRAIAWGFKTVFAMAWAVKDAGVNGFDELAAAAEQGYDFEAQESGDVALDLRNRTLANASALFIASQIVEGMERLAEQMIPTATTHEELEQIIADLEARQVLAQQKLNTLTEGGTNNA